MPIESLVALALLVLPQAPAPEVNPTTLSYVASPTHDQVVGETALLMRYEMKVNDGVNQVLIKDLGKPTPDPVTKVITLPLTGLGLPLNKTLALVIVALGPGGSATSLPSNPFMYLGPPGVATAVKVGTPKP